MKKRVSGITVTSLLTLMLVLASIVLISEIHTVSADQLQYIYIKADGTIDPSSAPVQRSGEIYTLTSDLSGWAIVIQRNGITFDGNNHTVMGLASFVGNGVELTSRSDVMVKNLTLRRFYHGFGVVGSSYCQLYHNRISEEDTDVASAGIYLEESSHISIFNNTIDGTYGSSCHYGIELNATTFSRLHNCSVQWTGSYDNGFGIVLFGSSSNDIFDNTVEHCHDGIGFQYGSNSSSIRYNTFYDNGKTEPYQGEGIGIYGTSSNNTLRQNKLWNNTVQVNAGSQTDNFWDGGYPSYSLGGNYWSNYTGIDNNTDGIGDSDYVINANDNDSYPLMQYNYTYRYLTVQSDAGGTTDPVPGVYPIPYPGMNMTVTARPNMGYQFANWTLDESTTIYDNPTTITMNANHTLRAHFAAAPPGCPYVYAWNGTNYVIDNNMLPASGTNTQADVEDYYRLEQPLVPRLKTGPFSIYSLQIQEFEHEHDCIDQVKLMAVDHALGTNIAVTSEGEVLTYATPAGPVSCVDQNGLDRLSEIGTVNGNVNDPSTYFQGHKDDWLVLNFGTVTAANAKLVLRDDQKCEDPCIDVQLPDQTGEWQTVEVLHPRNFWSMEAVNLTAYVAENGDLRVRLLWTATHRLDFVGLDTSLPARVNVISTPPILAVHSTLGNVRTELIFDDGHYVELVSGQQLTIAFMLPNNVQNTTRDFILYMNGHYYTITT